MMNYEIYPRMILRVPRFPVNKAGSSLDEILADPVFRDALYLGSDSMYAELNRHDFQLSKCSEKMKHSLAKYHKRICYRPTPFGAFAGLTILPWQEAEEPGIVIVETSFETRLIERETLSAQSGDSGERIFRVNPLLYESGSDFRVIGRGGNGNRSTFSISEIFGGDIVRELAFNPHTFSGETLLFILGKNGVKKEEIELYISQLIELQVILPHQRSIKDFPKFMVPVYKENPGSAYDSYSTFSSGGSFPQSTRNQLRDAIYCLDKLSSNYEPPALTNFKTRFERLFERREVPLLQALDPEIGIDYDGLTNPSLPEPGSKQAVNISWSPLHELLLGKWTTQSGRGIPEIEVREKDLSCIDTSHRNYPPACSVLFSLAGDKLHVRAAGGVSSLNMIGRFTVLDPEIRDLAKDLATKETEHNSGVLFAELSHIDDPGVASINCMAPVYKYQIPFFESPEVDDEFVIHLSDLYISLLDNHLILRSARLDKQIIPRFSSAYNYHKSTLPVFRFLCDLQHEGTSSNLNFCMASLFPGLPAYPRVTYKGVILEAASWRVEARDLSVLKMLEPATRFHAFSSFAAQVCLPEEFSYEVHDHLLHINLFSTQDIDLLLKTIPASGEIVLREYYKSQEELVKDHKGNSYTHECLAFLVNKEMSYSSITDGSRIFESSGIINMFPQKPVQGTKVKLFPFDEWLYFKIYLHPAGFPELLINHLQPFIAQNMRKGNISSWFFISYYDEDFHLRLRLRQIPGREGYLLKSYRKLERELRNLPNLKKLELSTYFKELERYALIGVESAEELFRLSSEIVLAELSQPDQINDPDKDRVFSGIRHLLIVCEVMGFGINEIEQLSKGFASQLKKSKKIELDLEFRGKKKELLDFLVRGEEKRLLEMDYLAALEKATSRLSMQEKQKVIADLNHMHLNRLYLYDQKRLELKSYYFLIKIMRTFQLSSENLFSANL